MSTHVDDVFYTSSDGLQLYCRHYAAQEKAGAQPVLCLPGLTRNSRDFAALAAHLSRKRDVFAADLRGRGRSQWDPHPSRYQLATYVQDAWYFLDSRGIDRVFIVGTSLGALMGMAMAAEVPRRIAGVVMNDAGPELDPVGLRRIAGYAGKLPPVTSWPAAAAQAKSVYGAALPDLDESGWVAYARAAYREDGSGMPTPDMDPKIAEAFNQTAAAPADLWPLFARTREVPLLVIRGALSDILSGATVARMAREHPHLEHIEVLNRGHTPLLDEPPCLAAIDAFLERSPPTSAQ